jgi:hypothetical protein
LVISQAPSKVNYGAPAIKKHEFLLIITVLEAQIRREDGGRVTTAIL